MNKSILFLWMLLFGINHGFSQRQFAYKNYTVEDGLPSSEVYSAFEDSKGYMWFATDAGVSRFNGYEFENFDVGDGLTDNTVFVITEDFKGRIWFGTFNCRLSYYFNGKIVPYVFNEKLENAIKGTHVIQKMHVDSEENVWLEFVRREGVKITNRGVVQGISANKNENTLTIIHDSDFYFESICRGLSGKLTFEDKKGSYFDTTYVYIKNQSTVKKRIPIKRSFPASKKNLFIGIFAQKIGDQMMYCQGKIEDSYLINLDYDYQIKQLKTPSGFKNEFISTYFDGNYLWIVLKNQGAFQCSIKADSLVIVNHYFRDKAISRVYRDKSNAYWFCMQNQGVFYMPNNIIHQVFSANESILSFEIDTTKNRLFYMRKNGDIVETKGLTSSVLDLNEKEVYLPLPDLYYDDFNHRLIYNGLNGIMKVSDDEVVTNLETNYTHNFNDKFKSILVDHDTTYIGNHALFSVLVDGKEFFLSDRKFPLWCKALLKHNGKVWIGTNNGVKIYDGHRIKNPYNEHPFLSTSITCLSHFTNESILIGTKSFGLILMRHHKIQAVIGEEKGLLSNLIKSVHVDNENTIWIGTNKGVSKLNLKANGEYSIFNITKKHGLFSEEITDIKSLKNNIYLLTPEGLLRFDKNQLSRSRFTTSMYFTNFKVNGSDIPLTHHPTLAYNQNYIRLSYVGINLKSQGEVNYQYRLKGIENDWQQTTTHEVQYPSLLPGSYIFEVKADNEDGLWSQPIQFSFTIAPPYWATWWFYTLVICCILLIIYVSFKTNVLVYNRHIQQELFNRFLKKLGKKNYLLVEVDRKKMRIDEDTILFMQSFKNYIEIICINSKHLCRATLSDMEKTIGSSQFIRVHRSYIVNKNKIDAISTKEISVDKYKIPVGKTYKSAIEDLKQNYFRINT